ncbi:major facilitator superfamily domain-containing protein [Fusarium oxysporum f. sp. albedinis]|nr:major facilitator superfamily domain-containing protein [Fusarium oxysporum f. sp. albedinis]
MATNDLDENLGRDPDSMILHRAHFTHEFEAKKKLDSTLLTSFPAIGGLLVGYDFGCINGLLRFESFIDAIEGRGTVKMSKNNVVLIVSLLFCGSIIGAITAGALGDRLGRKWLIQLSCAVYVSGVFLQMSFDLYDTAFILVLIGRLIGGIGTGLNSVGTVLYMTETNKFNLKRNSPLRSERLLLACHSSLRGFSLAAYQGCVALGLLIAALNVYAVDKRTDISAYRWLVGCQFIWPAVLAIAVSMIPESPRHLVNIGRNEEAYRALIRLRAPRSRDKSDIRRVQMELSEIYLSHEVGLGPEKVAFRKVAKGWLSTRSSGITRSVNLVIHPLTVSVLLHTMYQCTGVSFITFSTTSLAGTDEALGDPLVIALVLSIVQLCGTPVYMWSFKKLGQRWTLIVSALAISACHLLTAITGMTASVTDKGLVVGRVQLVLVALFVFVVASSWVPAFTGYGTGVISATTPYLVEVEWLRRSGIFLIFACLCLCSSLFVYFLVPETSKLFLEYIEVIIRESDPRTTQEWKPDGTFGWRRDLRTEVQYCRVPRIRKSWQSHTKENASDMAEQGK